MEFFFKDGRFSFTTFGDSIVRVIAYTTYVFLGATAFVLSFSDILRLRFSGFLLSIFLIDRLMQVGKGERRIGDIIKGKINVARSFTPRALRALLSTFRKTSATGGNFYFNLLIELLKDEEVRHILERLDANPKEFLEKTLMIAGEVKQVHSKDVLQGLVDVTAIKSYRNAVLLQESYVEPRNLFASLGEAEDPDITKLFYLFNISSSDVREVVLFSRHKKLFSGFHRIPRYVGEFAHIPHRRRERVMNRAWTARPTPLLDSLSRDLSTLAEKGQIGFLVGHEREYEALLRAISKPGKPNAILVGESGSGKSTIISRLAYDMVKDKAPKALFDKRLISLELSGLLSDGNEKEISARIQEMVKEIRTAGNIVLVIPDAHDLFKSHSEKGMVPIDFLLPIIREDGIPVICESTPSDVKAFIESRSDFLNQFEKVPVEEISEEEAMRYLVYESALIEREFSVFVTWKAIRRAVSLAHRYFHNRQLPGSAGDLLKQSAAAAREGKMKKLSEEVVVRVAEQISKIPIQRAEGGEVEKLLNLEAIIHKKFVDQKEAVAGVSRALREYRSGLSRRGGPIATFLFVGPTGVGKTELAKMLAEIQFGSRNMMRRFDMSEYKERASIERLIGSPSGNRSGALTDAILENPYSLVLLDEFEKAHPDILNLFLQVFDDGRLTDSAGRTVDFENTIIIATSNAGSDFVKSEIEKGTSMHELSEKMKRKLTEYFVPELLNRFSQIVVFKNLSPDELAEVVKFAFDDLAETLEKTHGIVLKTEPSAIQRIAEIGWSPVFGARPLRTALSEKVRSVLAEKILKKEIDRGNVISISWTGKVFEFTLVE